MDAFWGPLLILGGVLIVGIVIFACAIPFEESNDRDSKQIGDVLMKLGGGIAGIGGVGIVVNLIGALIEHLF